MPNRFRLIAIMLLGVWFFSQTAASYAAACAETTDSPAMAIEAQQDHNALHNPQSVDDPPCGQKTTHDCCDPEGPCPMTGPGSSAAPIAAAELTDTGPHPVRYAAPARHFISVTPPGLFRPPII